MIIGLFNVINFTPTSNTLSFGSNSFSIGIQPVSFFVGVLAITLLIPKRIDIKSIDSEHLVADNKKQYEENLERFKNLFISKSANDLNEIIADNRYTPAAKDAAEQVLIERQETGDKM